MAKDITVIIVSPAIHFCVLYSYYCNLPKWTQIFIVLFISGDGCISFVEFMKGRIHDTLKFSWALFNHFDHNDDDCLESWDQIQEFNEIDISRMLKILADLSFPCGSLSLSFWVNIHYHIMFKVKGIIVYYRFPVLYST